MVQLKMKHMSTNCTANITDNTCIYSSISQVKPIYD